MGNWNEDMLARQQDPSATSNAAALQAIKDNTAPLSGNATLLQAIKDNTALAAAKMVAAPTAAATTAQTLAAATAKQVLASNPSRLGAVFQNDTGQTVLLGFGAGTAGASSYAVKIIAGGYYELPFRFTGVVSAYSATASAAPHLLVTELS